MQFDPAKRLCLKNLPPDVTKKDIAELIRKRTRSQPQLIDLGQDDEGNTRRYAHVTVEGLKSVLEALNGAPLGGYNIIAEQAKPHFAFLVATDKRKREREEREEEESRAAKAAEVIRFWESQPTTICKERPPKSFYHSKQKYAAVASAIARQCRESHRRTRGEVGTVDVHRDTGKTNNKQEGPKGARRQVTKAAPTVVPQPVAIEEPPKPTKEERKLTGLQAKLAALREKMKSTSS